MKQILNWQLSLAIWLGIAGLSYAQNKNTIALADDERLIEFTTDRFTLPSLHVTQDGKSIIFDVLGDIYKVPIEGGKAEILLQDNNWKRAGKLSPDAKTLAYISDETGNQQVWIINLETKTKQVYPITSRFTNSLEPYWDKDNGLLIPSEEGLYRFNINEGDYEIIRHAKEEEKSLTNYINRTMIINNNKNSAHYQKNDKIMTFDLNDRTEVLLVDTKNYTRIINFKAVDETIVFYKQNDKDNLFHDLVSWNVKSGIFKTLNKAQSLGASTTLNYSFDFIDNTTIILNKEGQIVRMNTETGEHAPIPIEVKVQKIIKKPVQREPQYIKDSIITASVLRNPVTRKDLDTIYFGAFGKLHSYAKETEVITEIYPKEDRFEVSPSLSPDGKYLAYTTWNDTEMGHVYARELNTGREHQLTQTPGRYINPVWSPDGKEIVFIADETETKMGIPMQARGPNTNYYHLDLHRFNIFTDDDIQDGLTSDIIYRIHPFSQLSRRFYPVPIYQPNGRSVFITTQNHENGLPVLLEIDLTTREIVQERLIPFHTDEILVSPNTQYIAFIFDEKVWVDVFPHSIKLEFSENSEYISEQFHYKGGYVNNILLPEAKSVYEIAPSYLFWQDEHTLMWGSAEEIYTYDVRSGKTVKITEIKVQKPRAIPKAQYALTNAKIITMNKENEIIEKGTILVKDNRIEEVGELDEIEVPKNYKVFDLEGKTIIPGLIDVHAHYHHFPYEFQVQQNYKYIGNLAYGITTIYDPSVNVLDYREQAQRVEIGELLGPRVFASGNIILENPGRLEYDYKNIQSNKDASRLAKSISKLKVSGPIKEYGIRNSTKRQLLKDAANENNINLTSHQNIYEYAVKRILQGYFGIEHEIGSFPLQYDTIQLICQSEIYYTPTFMIRPGIKNIYVEKTLKERKKLLRLNGQILFHNYYGSTFENQNIEHQSLIAGWSIIGVREHERAAKTLKNIVESNGNITVGGHGNPLPGISTHWELWFMTKGMNNYQALQAATINGAKKLYLQEEIGSIEKGKLADVLVLHSDPVKDIFNSIDILYTIQNGNVYQAETMNQVYPLENKIKPWGWDSVKVIENMENIYYAK